MTRAARPARIGPGAMAVHEHPARAGIAAWSPARRLALLISVGIGLHNFAEGLAIGQSAARNEVALATVLVIGFATLNATEGFGIVAPLACDLDDTGTARRPGWGFLLTLGLIGGGPTFIGTAVVHGFTSDALSVAFLTLAAGSIIDVTARRRRQSQTRRPGLLRPAARPARRLRHRRRRHRPRRISRRSPRIHPGTPSTANAARSACAGSVGGHRGGLAGQLTWMVRCIPWSLWPSMEQ
jgi:hypothetical protein